MINQNYVTVKQIGSVWHWSKVYGDGRLCTVSRVPFMTFDEAMLAAEHIAECYNMPMNLSAQYVRELEGPDYGTPDEVEYDDIGYSESTQPYLW